MQVLQLPMLDESYTHCRFLLYRCVHRLNCHRGRRHIIVQPSPFHPRLWTEYGDRPQRIVEAL